MVAKAMMDREMERWRESRTRRRTKGQTERYEVRHGEGRCGGVRDEG